LYLKDRIAYKVSLDMIQALMLLKLVTTKKNNMEDINMEGCNIAEVAETPTFIDLSVFLETAQLKPIWQPILSLLVYFYLYVYCLQKQSSIPSRCQSCNDGLI